MTILIVGDVTEDILDFQVQTKERDGYPVLERRAKEWQYGCAAAVAAMVRGMGIETRVAADFANLSIKRRIIVNDKVLCRLDQEKKGVPPKDFPDADLVLVADYAKGVVTESVMKKLAAQFAGKEIIVDWHPSRLCEFYSRATAFKVSWPAPLVGRVIVSTYGKNGMSLVEPWDITHRACSFNAKNLSPLDPCGAGDMVLATLGVGRLLGLSWQECCEWASDNAAWVCGQWGSVPRDMTYEQWKRSQFKGEANELPAMR